MIRMIHIMISTHAHTHPPAPTTPSKLLVLVSERPFYSIFVSELPPIRTVKEMSQCHICEREGSKYSVSGPTGNDYHRLFISSRPSRLNFLLVNLWTTFLRILSPFPITFPRLHLRKNLSNFLSRRSHLFRPLLFILYVGSWWHPPILPCLWNIVEHPTTFLKPRIRRISPSKTWLHTSSSVTFFTSTQICYLE